MGAGSANRLRWVVVLRSGGVGAYPQDRQFETFRPLCSKGAGITASPGGLEDDTPAPLVALRPGPTRIRSIQRVRKLDKEPSPHAKIKDPGNNHPHHPHTDPLPRRLRRRLSNRTTGTGHRPSHPDHHHQIPIRLHTGTPPNQAGAPGQPGRPHRHGRTSPHPGPAHTSPPRKPPAQKPPPRPPSRPPARR